MGNSQACAGLQALPLAQVDCRLDALLDGAAAVTPLAAHQAALIRALILARGALWLSQPNPRVGCVITAPDGRVLGEGFTQHAGGPHAEVMALRDAASRGHDLRGAWAHVTLEPCAHQGRTGPCSQALIAAGIARVYAALADANPSVAGRGFAQLRAAGVGVFVCADSADPTDRAIAAAARALNVGFLRRMAGRRPWVRLKLAASIDGATALANGRSQWITGPAARADGHAWRARACAILTGSGTVLADDPQLNVRSVALPAERLAAPRVAVVDGAGRVAAAAKIFQNAAPSTIYTLPQTLAARAQWVQSITQAGGEVVAIGAENGAKNCDLHAIVTHLAQNACNEIHVEAGAGLTGALLGADLVDEIVLYQAPKILGQNARGLSTFGPIDDLKNAREFQIVDTKMVGDDLRIIFRKPHEEAL